MNKQKMLIYPTCENPVVGEPGIIKDGFFIPNKEIPYMITSCWLDTSDGLIKLYVSSSIQQERISYNWKYIAGLNKYGECIEVIELQSTSTNFLDVTELITTPNAKYYVADVEVLFEGENFYNIIYRCNFSTEEILKINKNRYKRAFYENYYLGKFFEKQAVFKLDKDMKESISGIIGSKSTVIPYDQGIDGDVCCNFEGRGRIRYEDIDVFGVSNSFLISFWMYPTGEFTEVNQKRMIFCEMEPSGRYLIECYLMRHPDDDYINYGYVRLYVNILLNGQTEPSSFYFRFYTKNTNNYYLKMDDWNYFLIWWNTENVRYLYFKYSNYSNDYLSFSRESENYSNARFLSTSDNIFLIGNDIDNASPWNGKIDELYIWKNLYLDTNTRNNIYNALYNKNVIKDKYSIVFEEKEENYFEIIYRGSHGLLSYNNNFISPTIDKFDSTFFINDNHLRSSLSDNYYHYILIDGDLYYYYNSTFQKIGNKKWDKVLPIVKSRDDYLAFGISEGRLYKIFNYEEILVNEWNNWTDISRFDYFCDYYETSYSPQRRYFIYGIAGGILYKINYDNNGVDFNERVFGLEIIQASEREGWKKAPDRLYGSYEDEDYYCYYGIVNNSLIEIRNKVEKIINPSFNIKDIFGFSYYYTSSSYLSRYSIFCLSDNNDLYYYSPYAGTFTLISSNVNNISTCYLYESHYNCFYLLNINGSLYLLKMHEGYSNHKLILLTNSYNGSWDKIIGYIPDDNNYYSYDYQLLGLKNGELYFLYINNEKLTISKVGNSNKWKDITYININFALGIRGY